MKDKNKIPQLLKKIKDLKSVKIRVGVFGNSQLATIAKANEYGTKTEDGRVWIPERSFIRSTFDKKSSFDKCLKFAKRLFDATGKVENVPQGIGATMASEIQATIESNVPPPNAESTVKAKGSDRTLQDTGRLKQGITYQIV